MPSLSFSCDGGIEGEGVHEVRLAETIIQHNDVKASAFLESNLLNARSSEFFSTILMTQSLQEYNYTSCLGRELFVTCVYTPESVLHSHFLAIHLSLLIVLELAFIFSRPQTEERCIKAVS